MKILFVDIKYDYGKKERGLNYIGQFGFKASMEKLGHEVIPFYYDEYLGDEFNLQKKLLDVANQADPDIIFFLIFKNHFKTATLDKLKGKYITVNWFGDDTWRFDSFTKNYASHFTWCITTDKFSQDKYRRIGVENVLLSQWAAIPSKTPPRPSQYQYDVTFVGGAQPSRKWFVKQLAKRGIKVECFGFGWPNGPLTDEKMVDIFSTSKVSLNLSNSVTYDLRFLLSAPSNFLYLLRSKKTNSQIKARNFEINYFGGFQLTEYVPGLEDYYDIGKHVACYSTVKEAEMLIKYYLIYENEREEIRSAGHQFALNRHSYYHRLKEVFEAIQHEQS